MALSSLFLIGNLGGSEVVIILVVLLLFFGAKKIPELARGLGKGVREFKDATSDVANSFQDEANRPATTATPLTPAEQALRDANAREAALREELERERAARAASNNV